MALGPLPGFFGAPQSVDRQTLRQLLPGRVPFIVPPASAKNSFLANPITRQLWQDALAAVSAADRVTFLGYSLPAGDQTFAGLLATAFAQCSPKIVVADLDPVPVVNRIKALGVLGEVTDTYSGLSAIEDLIHARVEERSGVLTKSLRLAAAEGYGDDALAISFDYTNTAAVIGASIETGTDRLVLTCEKLQDWTWASGDRHAGDISRPSILRLTDIQRALDLATTIQVQYDGIRYPLVQGDLVLAATGAANRWLMLTTAASLRNGVDTGNTA